MNVLDIGIWGKLKARSWEKKNPAEIQGFKGALSTEQEAYSISKSI